jgi:tryptophanase
VISRVVSNAENIRGLRIAEEAPWLRHFTAKLSPVTG